MSDWRTRVDFALWRARLLESLNWQDINRVFVLEALIDNEWEEFGRIDMDVAGEGWGASVAEHIVRIHNVTI